MKHLCLPQIHDRVLQKILVSDSIGVCLYGLRTIDMPVAFTLLKGYFTFDEKVMEHPDVSVCVDCGDFGRFPMRREKFLSARTTVCVDHHGTTQNFCDYNYVDSAAAATGELIYALIKEMVPEADVETGEAIFAAITTDTGNFQYSNTTKNCHLIMAELYDLGVDTNKVSVEIYENERQEKLMITARALSALEIFGGGCGAISHLTLEDMKEIGAEPFETDGVIQKLRSISGVEYAALVKEKEPGVIRVSMRAKRRGNVATIASELGGGGPEKRLRPDLSGGTGKKVRYFGIKTQKAVHAFLKGRKRPT